MVTAAMAATASAAGTYFSALNPSSSIKFHVSLSCSSSSLKLSSLPSFRAQKLFSPLRPSSMAQYTELDEKEEMEEMKYGKSIWREEANRRKLYVVNLPWSYSASDLENLFGQCGTVNYVEIIKLEDGRNRGFAFVTMASPEEAQTAIEKLNSFEGFDLRTLSIASNVFTKASKSEIRNRSMSSKESSYELVGRIIKVQLAKTFNKPKKPRPSTPVEEPRHKIYVGNLHWKARAGKLREFFSTKFKPISARVVFDNPSKKSAGYGFVSFDTKEEVETAISELDGVELMGRPLRLKLSQKGDESETRQEDSTQGHFEGSSNLDCGTTRAFPGEG